MAEKFEKAVEIVSGLPKDGPTQPTDDDKLTFYAYFKIATGEGDKNVPANTPSPGRFDFVGRAKWGAWNDRYTTLLDEEKTDDNIRAKAKQLYVEKLLRMVEGSDAEEAKAIVAQLK